MPRNVIPPVELVIPFPVAIKIPGLEPEPPGTVPVISIVPFTECNAGPDADAILTPAVFPEEGPEVPFKVMFPDPVVVKEPLEDKLIP